MKIRDFQQKIADALNGVDELVQGGCKALAENTLSIIHDVELQLQQAAGVAIIVTTPSLTRNGASPSAIFFGVCPKDDGSKKERRGSLRSALVPVPSYTRCLIA